MARIIDNTHGGKNALDEAGESIPNFNQDLLRSEIPNPTPIQQDAYNRHLNKTLDERADTFIKLDAAKDTKGIKNARANWNEATLKAAREAGNEEKREINRARTMQEVNKKKGGKVCGMKKGGKVRGCGCAQRGLTKGRMV